MTTASRCCLGSSGDITLRQRPDLHALRLLRLHHWREACRLADSLCSQRGSPEGRANWKKLHAVHMGHVQALNDLFPIGDTAERDAATMQGVRQALLQPRVTLPCPTWRECQHPRRCTAEQCFGWPARVGNSVGVFDLERKVCTYCGQEGHRAHTCPVREQERQRSIAD